MILMSTTSIPMSSSPVQFNLSCFLLLVVREFPNSESITISWLLNQEPFIR